MCKLLGTTVASQGEMLNISIRNYIIIADLTEYLIDHIKDHIESRLFGNHLMLNQ